MNPNQTHQGTSAVRTAVRLSLLASTVVAAGFSYTAMAAAPVVEAELEEVKGKIVFEVAILKNGSLRKTLIDSVGGNIVK